MHFCNREKQNIYTYCQKPFLVKKIIIVHKVKKHFIVQKTKSALLCTDTQIENAAEIYMCITLIEKVCAYKSLLRLIAMNVCA